MLICIDAGHGRNTAGRRCMASIDPNETREWVLNSRTADLLTPRLEAMGCEVIRVDDPTGEEDVSLAARVSFANYEDADAYISIHHNAGISGGSGGGTVVYTCKDPQELSKQLQETVYRHTTARTGLVGNRANPTPESDLYVLRHTSMPAILIECGFMDSATDTPIILTEEFAEQVAEGIAAAVAEVYDLTPAKPELTEERVREIVREEIGLLLERWTAALTEDEA